MGDFYIYYFLMSIYLGNLYNGLYLGLTRNFGLALKTPRNLVQVTCKSTILTPKQVRPNAT